MTLAVVVVKVKIYQRVTGGRDEEDEEEDNFMVVI